VRNRLRRIIQLSQPRRLRGGHLSNRNLHIK
jgi:hypothetical protein